MKIGSKDALVGFIIGLLLGLFLAHQPEKHPHNVWVDRDGFIMVVQKPGSYVYTFAEVDYGYYEHLLTMSPKSPLYPEYAK